MQKTKLSVNVPLSRNKPIFTFTDQKPRLLDVKNDTLTNLHITSVHQ